MYGLDWPPDCTTPCVCAARSATLCSRTATGSGSDGASWLILMPGARTSGVRTTPSMRISSISQARRWLARSCASTRRLATAGCLAWGGRRARAVSRTRRRHGQRRSTLTGRASPPAASRRTPRRIPRRIPHHGRGPRRQRQMSLRRRRRARQSPRHVARATPSWRLSRSRLGRHPHHNAPTALRRHRCASLRCPRCYCHASCPHPTATPAVRARTMCGSAHAAASAHDRCARAPGSPSALPATRARPMWRRPRPEQRSSRCPSLSRSRRQGRTLWR